MATDPVCGMTVEPKESAGKAKFLGHEYFFCSNDCREKFTADPAKYNGMTDAVSMPPKGAAPSAPGVQYTCPMHPQIVRNQPGSCPICGMALEPLRVTAESKSNPELAEMTLRPPPSSRRSY